MRRSVIVDTISRIVFHSALMFSLYLLFAGHNQPGGGFVGGLVTATAFALVYVAGGIEAVRSLSRLQPWVILGAGLFLAAMTALLPLVAGEAVLQSSHTELDLDAVGLGHVELSTALAFDIGVYGVVIGMVLMVVHAFGEAPVESKDGDQ